MKYKLLELKNGFAGYNLDSNKYLRLPFATFYADFLGLKVVQNWGFDNDGRGSRASPKIETILEMNPSQLSLRQICFNIFRQSIKNIDRELQFDEALLEVVDLEVYDLASELNQYIPSPVFKRNINSRG